MRNLLFLFITVAIISGCNKQQPLIVVDNNLIKITVPHSGKALWEYTIVKTGKTFSFQPPEFEIDGKSYTALLSSVKIDEPHQLLNNGVNLFTVEGKLSQLPDISLVISFRISKKNPVVKFRYELATNAEHQLTKAEGNDKISYFKVSLDGFSLVKEIRFSEFNEMVHSFCLSERLIEPKHFADSMHLMGPVVTASDNANSFIIGYEHGSQVPDKFLEYELGPDRSVKLKAYKGNYYNGYKLNKSQSFQSLWF
jgi:hypothetical protein